MNNQKCESVDYSSRIISPADTFYEPTGKARFIIDIIDDATLAYGKMRTTLHPDTLALNGLLLLRHKGWVRHAEVKDVVGFNLGPTALNTRLHKLSRSIEEMTDFPDAVESQGNGKHATLRLSPFLDFNDIRGIPGGFGVIHERYDEQSLPRTVFVTAEHRRRALSHLFQRYTEHPQVALHMAYLQYENEQKSKEETELSPDDIHTLLAYIECGLHAYLHNDDEEAKLHATNAYYSLLASVTPMVTGLAASKSWIHMEELVQEGLACITETIMDLSGNEDLRKTAEGFYPICLSIASHKYSNFITREVAANRCMSTKALRLEHLIQAVEKRFVQEHHRIPTELEVHAELNDPSISLQRVGNAILRMQFGHPGTSHYDQYEHIDRSAALSAAIDDQIERVYREDIATKVFADETITVKEKVMLSLYYGIFVENLRGAEIRKTKKGPVFTYPYDATTFESLAQQTVGNMPILGSMLDYSHRGVGKILEAARAKAHADLEQIVGDDTSF